MLVLEKFVIGKSKDLKNCEDGIVITKNMVAVIDGVTSKTGKLFEGKKGGVFCKDFIADFIVSEGHNIYDAEEFLSLMSARLGEEITTRFPGTEYMEWPRASLIVFNAKTNEIWNYGDCQCMINGKGRFNLKKVDVLTAQLRAWYLEHAMLKGASLDDLQRNDIGREAIEPLLREQVIFENIESEFGYPVINGRKIKPKLIKKYKVEKGDMVVLATDGYPILKQTLKESENELKTILEDDPLCFRKFKTTKGIMPGNISYDDRAYCRIEV